MNIRTDILLRVYIAFGLIVLFAFAVVAKLFHVQFVQGKKWTAMADSLSTKYVNVEAVRGNIYSVDGSLLATSVPEYELRMDLLAGGIEKDDVFYEKVDSLAYKMSAFFGDKSARQYSRMLREARRERSRYFLIRRKVTHNELSKIKKFPIFNLGRYKGGLITVQMNKRILPFQTLAARTIGYKNENVQPVGLEGAYGRYIDGETGKRLMQRIAGGIWMPVNRDIEIAPKDGADIISTIDINMQDVAQNALLKQLEKSQADHGCVVMMEVATGEIRAIANYTRTVDGDYKEKFNYAIAGNQDPGSTFKVASYMSLLEDHKVDTNTRVETGNYKIPGHLIKDSHGSIGVVSVKRAFEESSNSAVAKLINTAYHDNQSQFTDHLYEWGLNEKLGLQIPGEAQPVVKNPKNRSWNKNMTLPQMAYGYEMQLTPLKMLTFYNAIANNGKYVSPIFVREIRRLGNTVEQFKARVINDKICSDVTLKKMKEMLEGVITEGTGKGIIYNPAYKIAGKTGTAQVADANKGYKAKKQYQASFCGYFPADKPKYSLIVVINDPKNEYYAALVAGPPFREIADKVYASDLDLYESPVREKFVGNTKMPSSKLGSKHATQQVYSAFGIKAFYASNNTNSIDTNNGVYIKDVDYREGSVPNVVGMGLRDALFAIGNAGLKPVVKGSGKVVSQSVAPGMRVGMHYPLQIELQ
ncbi:PASTA domain-containing protein [Pedobacter sp. HMF7647]|uniref:PASTA domain-containing protein n=1 Tax=Hufsiella arboris TaxID=2695275 RepID=A0A7K1YEH1_9SPHI|nr:penicillin-binding protein [Hufsiella arboris]MXV52771.1 PASTA domain-containing protein [Hufsiella arboris]